MWEPLHVNIAVMADTELVVNPSFLLGTSWSSQILHTERYPAYRQQTHTAGKFGKFDESSVIHQTKSKTIQISTYN